MTITIIIIVDNFVAIFLLLWGMGVRQNMQTFLVCNSCIWGYFPFFFNVLSGSESIESHSQKGYETITEDFFREAALERERERECERGQKTWRANEQP